MGILTLSSTTAPSSAAALSSAAAAAVASFASAAVAAAAAVSAASSSAAAPTVAASSLAPAAAKRSNKRTRKATRTQPSVAPADEEHFSQDSGTEGVPARRRPRHELPAWTLERTGEPGADEDDALGDTATDIRREAEAMSTFLQATI
ncbi:hypothetical protein CF335_g6423 [Tilletia laevis]|nr:hypothetical protein CF335_g6423 [Tilletia laevis]